MTRKQIIIVSIGATIVLLVVLVFSGLIPGLKSTNAPQKVALEFWGVEPASAFAGAIAAYKTVRPNTTIHYRELSPATYESEILNGLASGRGPDIFMFRHNWLPKYIDKIVPSSFPLTEFQKLYPRVVEQDFAPNGIVGAFPLYIDTLALIYNKEIFDRKGIALPPTSWADVQDAIVKIREVDKRGTIALAGIALGRGAPSVHNASDLLGFFMLQNGTEMVSADFSRATFDSNVGLAALNFYLQFADPNEKLYTWNSDLGSSLDAFAGGAVAMIIDYRETLRALQSKNAFLRIGVTAMPQPATFSQRVDYADYYGLAVTSQSRLPGYAGDFIKFMTTNADTIASYLAATGHPPALRTLISAAANDPELGLFAKQALTARSWPQGDDRVVENSFSDMIENIATGRQSKQRAVAQAADAITQTMRRR